MALETSADYWPEGQRFHGPDGRRAYGKYQTAARVTLDLVFRHTAHCGTILHGGGHIGVVSLALATRFAHVRVFEAADDNYAWLAANVAHEPRIAATYGALGDGQPSAVVRHKYSATHHVRGPGNVPCYRIDDLGLTDLDVVLLDLEGGEMVALHHAQETILRCRPLLVIEEWPRWMPRYRRQPGDVDRLLTSLGYTYIDAAGFDLVFRYGD